MTKRLKKPQEVLSQLLLEKVYEYKKYQYQKRPSKTLLAKQSEEENIEITRYRDWYEKEYAKEKAKGLWERETVLHYILYYQIWTARKNQNSWATKQIYRREALAFAKYLAYTYKATDYRNVEDKHIESYVQNLLKQGLKPITIQKKLYGVYYHYTILQGKNALEPIQGVLEDVKKIFE